MIVIVLTVVLVQPGACGLKSMIKINSNNKHEVSLQFETECEAVKDLAKELVKISIFDFSQQSFIENKVYRIASKHIKHVSCPIPCGILKGAEAELNLAVKADVKIELIK
jgi:hypothetical protein